MSRSTRTMTAAVAAFAALAPAAVAMPQDGPIRTSSLAGTTTTPRVDLRSPDARDAAAGRFPGSHRVLPSGHHVVSSTTAPRIVRVDASDGFDWTDALIGAGGGFGALALMAGGGVALRRTRVRQAAVG